jgi:hypothetical protein
MEEEYSIEKLVETFKIHEEQTELENKDHIGPYFNLCTALRSICEEIVKLKASVETKTSN